MKKVINKSKSLLATLLSAAAMVFMLYSCIGLEEDTSRYFFDELNSETSIEAALAPIYSKLKRAYRAPRQRITTFGGDDITTWWRGSGSSSQLRVFDRFAYGSGENSDGPFIVRYAWENYWEVIYYSNNLIESLKTSTAPADAVARAEGEARFMRGWCYFILVRQFGGMPLLLDLRDMKATKPRSTVLETYEAIEKDFIKAAGLLPEPSQTSPGKVSSAAANTALASLYLTWGGWPVKDATKYGLAATAAKKVIDFNYFELLDIHELWKQENQNSLESVFAVQFSEVEDIRSYYPQGFNFHESRGWSDCYPELRFFYDFPEGARKEASFLTEIPQREVVDGAIVDKDPATLPWQESGRQHPVYKKFTLSERLDLGDRAVGFRAIEVFRYAEVLLIYAEAKLHTSPNNASALEALNQVKRRAAGLDNLTPNPSVDVNWATPNDVVDESGWELAGEFKRWFDLVRTERVEEMAAKRDPNENVRLYRQPTKAQYIAPIPAAAIFGSKLVQNPEGFVVK